ncbi:MAG: ADP-glyceromanno-heptose 6-epimerase [Leptospiraceae bacterium]|nr:ADP-glyceromanno-heptose 6-epimerase [Leptospiraceae bacterium]
MKKHSTIVVTGGAGLIGSACVEELNQRGIDKIWIVDNLGQSEKWKNLTRLSYVDYFEKEDFIERVIHEDGFLNSVSHILHLGACSSTTEKDASYLISNNYEYTKILCHAALQNDAKFVYASSAATYGEGEEGYDDNSPIQNLKPLNMYGYSKHMFDLYALKEGISERIVGLKYFNVFGFGEAHKAEMRSLVLKGYEQIFETGKLNLFKSYRNEYKDGEQMRDFLYVKDAAKMSIFFLFNDKFGLYNLGRGVAETWNTLAKALFEAMHKPVSIEYIAMPEHLKAKYQYYTCATTDKLIKAGYSDGFTSIQDAVADYVRLLKN